VNLPLLNERSLAFLVALAACGDGEEQDSSGEETGEPTPRGALQLRWPLQSVEAFYQTTGVDHDPEVQGGGIEAAICTNYDGRAFPWCYDVHKGSDYLMTDGFDAMDAGSQPIVAAADGVVVDTDDGHYDRCHVDGESQSVSCDGHEMAPNYVTLEHEGGWHTRYLHMKSESVAVSVGDTVACGERLGLVGSSGNSSGPHLHLQLELPGGEGEDDVVVDPYAGAWSQPETWWVEQGDPEGFPGMNCAGDP
jgi:murein DD-endopeptidase MepM/ murein hydrolase activator NlpD